MILLRSLVFLFTSLILIPLAAADEGVGMVTGSKIGTYYQFGNDIARVAKTAGLDIVVKESKGSVENIERMTSRENAAFGIVQSDVLGWLSRSTDPEKRRLADRMRLIFPFYKEEVHLFANKNIQSFKDLQGKRISVGEEGSGHWLTATHLLDIMGVKPDATLHMKADEAIAEVLHGNLDAVIFVGGKPVPAFVRLGELKEKPEYGPLFQNVHFVPLADPTMLREYQASTISPDDYKLVDKTIPTIAAKSVLMSFDFSSRATPYFKQRCQELAKLGQAIRSNIDDLRKNGHPKWKEVDLEAEVITWKQDSCSRGH
jgi:TRAP transporter TAXI family solute receptor